MQENFLCTEGCGKINGCYYLPSLTLIGAIQIPTVSFSPEELNTTALAEFGEYIHKGQPQTVQKG